MSEILPLPDCFAAPLRALEGGLMDARGLEAGFCELAQRAGWITSSDPPKLTALGREALDQHTMAQRRRWRVATLKRCQAVADGVAAERSNFDWRSAAVRIANEIQKLIDVEEARNG